MDLSNITVPASNMAAMVFTCVFSFALPIALMIIWYKKTGARAVDALIGAGAFAVFALMLEGVANNLVASLTEGSIADNIWIYAAYGGLAAGVFEETARFISMKFIIKKNLTREGAVMYGIGHGGLEAISICGVSMISNLVLASKINEGLGNTLFEGMPAELMQISYEQLSPLWTSSPGLFLLSAVERVGAIALHICLSYMVYRAVRDSRYLLFVGAIALHAVIDMSTVLLSATGISAWLVELMLLAVDGLFVGIVVRNYRRESEEGSVSDMVMKY
ncbi:MAG: YhfC family intramembrane metalloprotease [Lachnospiraceae bacterium]|nr:YhfC family intramembrane metalloprotease [Lachnospiraceae bacterium]